MTEIKNLINRSDVDLSDCRTMDDIKKTLADNYTLELQGRLKGGMPAGEIIINPYTVGRQPYIILLVPDDDDYRYVYTYKQIIRKCPVCYRLYTDHPAISRSDTHQEICPECGQKEALAIFAAYCKAHELKGDN